MELPRKFLQDGGGRYRLRTYPDKDIINFDFKNTEIKFWINSVLR